MSLGEFAQEWADRPFILTQPVRAWRAYMQWSTDYLLEAYGNTDFRAEAVDWSLKDYWDYMENNQDESPLYLFDHSFVEKMDLKVGNQDGGHYSIPECFEEDLFDVLDNQRPDRRWLIIGPNRSVYVSEDQSEVTSPLSITEWLLEFHAEARQTPGCMEGICKEGEVLHVPSGWWHLVVNLEPSIAITQNFVPRAHLANALAFLKDKPEQVSGFKNDVTDPYALFVNKLGQKHPDLLEEGLAKVETLQANKKRKWAAVVKADEEEGFGFGFGDGDDEEVP
ncbi:MAG: hypothetical protein LQ344_002564 [Seirophora lacunosa]|nr:MAG: hypothetical protein LQ344_002564 [Seirophora lacunosa]